VAFGYQEKFSKIVYSQNLTYIHINRININLGSIGAAIAVVITELIICVLMYLALKRLKIL
jgi:Na+-driven multidrug efflux pump